MCTLKCPACPNGIGILGNTDTGIGYLEFDNFKRIVDQNPFLSEIEITNWGETFLNPEILHILEYAHRKKVTLTAGTNLNNISEDVLEGMVKYKLRHLVCSIDGASSETYSIYRVNGDFETVIKNIETINHYKERYRSKYPLLQWQFIIFGHNEHEISAGRKMAGEMHMDFYPLLPLNMNFTEGDPFECEFSPVRDKELVRRELGYATRQEYREIHGAELLQGICLQLWDQPAINWDGTVMGCCATTRGFGSNAFSDGLLNSINTEKMIYARDMVQGKQPPRHEIPCSKCSLYLDMKENGRWINRSAAYRALRFSYGYIRLPYGAKWSVYRMLKLAKLRK